MNYTCHTILLPVVFTDVLTYGSHHLIQFSKEFSWSEEDISPEKNLYKMNKRMGNQRAEYLSAFHPGAWGIWKDLWLIFLQWQ